MKVTGAIAALLAAAPLASAIPFRMSDYTSPSARSAAPAPDAVPKEAFPVYRATNITARGINDTVVVKRSFVPDGVAPRNITKV